MRRHTLLLLVSFVAVGFAGCKTKGDTGINDTDTAVDTDSGGDADTDTDSDTDSDSDTDTDTDTDTDSGEDTAAACWVDSSAGTCWDCELPTTAESDSLKFLNQCSDVTFAAFDNAARIPSSTWVPGTALPNVP